MKTFITNGNHVELFIPMMKFDERTGEFEGWSTMQEIDSHSEICDVDKSWPALVRWAAEQEALSQGKSVGNLRVQHKRDSLGGKLIAMERCEKDGVDAVRVAGVITNVQARKDAAEGVITGISVRGLADRWEEPDKPGVMRYAWTVVEEKSLVDRPAVPHALIEVLKSDGGIEMVKAEGRQPAQFWHCGIEPCTVRHAKKEEAIKCEGGLPSLIEATKSADAGKSLWRIADIVSALTTLLYVLNDSQWEEAWRVVEGEDADPAIATSLKESAQKMFDAIQAILADERVAAEIDVAAAAEPVADVTDAGEVEMAMSATMRAIARSPAAKQLLKSLRVPSGNGSNHTSKEGAMDKKKAEGDVATELEAITKSLDELKALCASMDERIKALEGATAAPADEETAKSIDGLRAQIAVIAKSVEGVAELQKSYEQVAEGFETLMGALPTRPKGQLRAVDKTDDADKQKSAGDNKPANPWVDKVQRLM